jgi:hypothetical protein
MPLLCLFYASFIPLLSFYYFFITFFLILLFLSLTLLLFSFTLLFFYYSFITLLSLSFILLSFIILLLLSLLLFYNSHISLEPAAAATPIPPILILLIASALDLVFRFSPATIVVSPSLFSLAQLFLRPP